MPARKLSKSVFARTFRATQDVKSAQMLKTNRTSRIVAYLLATRGVCMSESMRYKHNQVVVMDPKYTHLLQALAAVTM